MKMKSKLTIFLTPSFFTSNSSWTRHSRIFLLIKTSTNQLMFVHRHWFGLENEQGSWPTVSAECSIIYSFLPQDHTPNARKAIPSEWNIISYRSSIPQYSSSRMIGARGFVILSTTCFPTGGAFVTCHASNSHKLPMGPVIIYRMRRGS